ncbi:MAG: protein kinase [Gemmataceae bacterium]
MTSFSGADDPPPQSAAGDYHRLTDIRVGPLTVVWRGGHPNPEVAKRVTVKEPAPGLPTETRAAVVDRLAAEHAFFARLNCPRLALPVAPFDPADGRLLLEDVQGHLRRDGHLSPPAVTRVLIECLTALAYLHERKLAHGRLAPESVLVAPNGTVKLGDFAGYRAADGWESLPPADYPVRHPAPELLAPTLASSPTARAVGADLYALGYLALELLAGPAAFDRLFGDDAHPGPDGTWTGWHADPGRRLPPLSQALPDVPSVLLDVLAGLVEKDPTARRFRSARDVLVELEESRLASPHGLPPLDPALEASLAVEKRRRVRALRVAPREALELWAPGGVVHALRVRPGGRAVIGRGPHCHLRLTDRAVSDRHALIACHETNRWWVYDLATRTGIRVDGAATSAVPLPAGSRLKVGATEYTVKLTPYARPDLGEFELGRVLHAAPGGAELRVARWVRSGLPAAVRLIPPAGDLEAVTAWVKAVGDGDWLTHPNLVPVYRTGFVRRSGERVWYLATEYLPVSLRAKLAGGNRLDPAEAVRVGRAVCKGLAAAKDVAHGELTPSRVVFAADGTPKLNHLFVATGEGGITLRPRTWADPADRDTMYRAPERAGGGQPTTAGDVFSLAVCLYESLTGRPPGDSPTPPRKLDPRVSVELDESLMIGMAKDPSRRPATPQEFDGWLSVCGG